VLADAFGAQRIDIESGPTHADAEADRADRTLLADHLGQVLKVVGGIEGEPFRRAAPAQLDRWQRLDLVHPPSGPSGTQSNFSAILGTPGWASLADYLALCYAMGTDSPMTWVNEPRVVRYQR